MNSCRSAINPQLLSLLRTSSFKFDPKVEVMLLRKVSVEWSEVKKTSTYPCFSIFTGTSDVSYDKRPSLAVSWVFQTLPPTPTISTGLLRVRHDQSRIFSPHTILSVPLRGSACDHVRDVCVVARSPPHFHSLFLPTAHLVGRENLQ